MPSAFRSPRARRPGPPPRFAPPTVTEFVRVAGLALIYAVLHWGFALVPLTLPVGEHYYVSLRPGVLVPLLVGLAAGPGAGLGVGVAGRLLGELLAGGLTPAALLYSGLLGLVAGLGARPDDNARTLRTQGRAVLWVLLATAAAALAATLLVETVLLGQFDLAAGWDRTVSEFLSGAISALLLLPAALYLFGRRPAAR